MGIPLGARAFSGGKMSNGYDFAFAIGGAAGQGIATPGNILARIFVRRGLHLYAYNAFQSIIRGGHIFSLSHQLI